MYRVFMVMLQLTLLVNVFACAGKNSTSRSEGEEATDGDLQTGTRDGGQIGQQAASIPIPLDGLNLATIQFSRPLYLPASSSYLVYVDAVRDNRRLNLVGAAVTWRHKLNDNVFSGCAPAKNGQHHQECTINSAIVGVA